VADSYSQQSTLLRQRITAQVSDATAKKMLIAITAQEENDLNDYPPATQANRPWGFTGRSYYKRGTGTVTKKRTYLTSERFEIGWKQQQHGSRRRDLYNNTSYGGYIMGNKQVSWAKARGWKNIKDELKKRGPDYLDLAARVVANVNRGTG